MLYRKDAPGNWGEMRGTPAIEVGEDQLAMPDGCKLFLRYWRTTGSDVLLILHGLGGHGGWYLDLANTLALSDISTYTIDHRGFGRSEGLPGHVDRYQQYVEDLASVVQTIQRHHPQARIHMLGHSMGGIFTTHFAASRYGKMLTSVIFLNPWIQDSAQMPLTTTLGIFTGGLFKSRHLWRIAGGHEGMTTNPDAIEMLQADPFWRRQMTATFLVQVFFMRLAVLKKAKTILIPALVLQAEQDRSVVLSATRAFYETLPSPKKSWITYPNYAHDTQLEADRSLLDRDLISWIQGFSSIID